MESNGVTSTGRRAREWVRWTKEGYFLMRWKGDTGTMVVLSNETGGGINERGPVGREVGDRRCCHWVPSAWNKRLARAGSGTVSGSSQLKSVLPEAAGSSNSRWTSRRSFPQSSTSFVAPSFS